MKKTRPLRAPVYLMLTLFAACAALAGEPDEQYRVRAIPGPDAYEMNYIFRRREVAIRASAREDGGTPRIQFEFENLGRATIVMKSEYWVLRPREGGAGAAVRFIDDKDKESTELLVLPYETKKIGVSAGEVGAPCVLEVRGVRDERGDGGFDFDLFLEVAPEEDAAAKPPTAPGADDDPLRRPLHQQLQGDKLLEKKK